MGPGRRGKKEKNIQYNIPYNTVYNHGLSDALKILINTHTGR